MPVPAPWEERLGYAPELITVKTLEATTQVCSSPVEMDRRENPRQHRKTRIQALHPRRITGRTDSDTFFSSVKSVRKFMSAQIFFCVLRKLLYVKGMRRESHSHAAALIKIAYGMWGRRICYLPITVKLRLGRSEQKQVEKILRNKSNRPHITKIKTKPNERFETSRRKQS
jgi:hypothetical protein